MEETTTQDEIHQEEKERPGSSEVGRTDPKERGLKSHHFLFDLPKQTTKGFVDMVPA